MLCPFIFVVSILSQGKALYILSQSLISCFQWIENYNLKLKFQNPSAPNYKLPLNVRNPSTLQVGFGCLKKKTNNFAVLYTGSSGAIGNKLLLQPELTSTHDLPLLALGMTMTRPHGAVSSCDWLENRQQKIQFSPARLRNKATDCFQKTSRNPYYKNDLGNSSTLEPGVLWE